MTTGSDLETRALVPMRDTAREYFPSAELLAYMNEAIEDLCARERLVRAEENVIVAAGVLPLPADLLQTRWLTSPTGDETAWMDETTFHSYVDTDPNRPATSPIASIWEDNIHVHPTPTNGETWVLGYYGLPAVMAAMGSTFPLRRIWERKVVAFMQYRMYGRLDEPQLSADAHAVYLEGLRPAQAITDHQVPGRVNLAREPGIFDTDPQAIHRGG